MLAQQTILVFPLLEVYTKTSTAQLLLSKGVALSEACLPY